jgi:hypothetical protein
MNSRKIIKDGWAAERSTQRELENKYTAEGSDLGVTWTE